MVSMAITVFDDEFAYTKHDAELSETDLAEKLANPSVYRGKGELKLIKLARFGDKRTDRNCLRHDENVLAISGIEGDYDGEQIPMRQAAALCEQAGIRALFYTSPSHTPDKPRWRVVAPLSKEHDPGERYRLVSRLNGVLGGILFKESWTLSQSYYIGQVQGAHYESADIDGDYIDTRTDLDARAVGKPNGSAGENGAPEGGDPLNPAQAIHDILTGANYHEGLTRLAARYVSLGIPGPDVIAFLRGVMLAARAGADLDRWQERYADISRAVSSAEKFSPEAADELLLPWDSPANIGGLLLKTPAPMQWFVNNRIQLGRGGLITGIGGSSKTRFLYHLAIGAALGALPWGWEIGKTGKSILVLTEDTIEDVHRTMHAISSGMGLSADERERIEQSVILYPLAGQDVKLLAKNERGALVKTPHFYTLEEKIAEVGGVVFVGIDPALSVTEGDEGDQNHQRSLGKMVDDLAVRTGAAAMLAAHSPKGSQLAEELSSHNSRGGGAITDAVRGEYGMRTMTASEAKKAGITDIEERKRHVQLVATKGNHLPPSAYVPVWMRRGDFGVLSAADISLAEDDGPNPQEMEALEILRDMAKTASPRLEDWRQRCIDSGVITQKTKGAQKKAMDRITKRLRDAGLVESGYSRGIYQPVVEE